MSTFEWLLVAWTTVFTLNLVPYFMPPTWAVVTSFLIAFQPPLWPLAIGCAFASTAGRCGLYYVSARLGRRLLSDQRHGNVAALGNWLNQRPGWRGVLDVRIYPLGPIPSNDLFIAAGLSGAKLWPVASGCLPGRMVSYPLLALAAKGADDRAGWNPHSPVARSKVARSRAAVDRERLAVLADRLGTVSSPARAAANCPHKQLGLPRIRPLHLHS